MDIFDLFFDWTAERVDATKIDGLEVSTVFASDEGYETAIIDKNGAYPVERYKNLELAKKGHRKWCKKAKILTEVVQLEGFSGLVPKEKILLERKKE